MLPENSRKIVGDEGELFTFLLEQCLIRLHLRNPRTGLALDAGMFPCVAHYKSSIVATSAQGFRVVCLCQGAHSCRGKAWSYLLQVRVGHDVAF